MAASICPIEFSVSPKLKQGSAKSGFSASARWKQAMALWTSCRSLYAFPKPLWKIIQMWQSVPDGLVCVLFAFKYFVDNFTLSVYLDTRYVKAKAAVKHGSWRQDRISKTAGLPKQGVMFWQARFFLSPDAIIRETQVATRRFKLRSYKEGGGKWKWCP